MNYELSKKYLGVDWGEKRIGLALADGETKMATPFKVVKDVNEVAEAINAEKIDVVVLGKPWSIMNDPPLAEITNEKYNKFIKDLKDKTNLPVELADERLSSKAADALVGDKKTNPPSPRLRRASASRDEIAAMIILQSYLDKI
jgi:putative Holliday junction resolvase